MNVEDVVKFVVLPVGTTLAALWLKTPIEKFAREKSRMLGLRALALPGALEWYSHRRLKAHTSRFRQQKWLTDPPREGEDESWQEYLRLEGELKPEVEEIRRLWKIGRWRFAGSLVGFSPARWLWKKKLSEEEWECLSFLWARYLKYERGVMITLGFKAFDVPEGEKPEVQGWASCFMVEEAIGIAVQSLCRREYLNHHCVFERDYYLITPRGERMLNISSFLLGSKELSGEEELSLAREVQEYTTIRKDPQLVVEDLP